MLWSSDMLHPGIVQLKQFYSTRLGVAVADMVGRAITGMWPRATDDAMLVIGYGAPYISQYLSQATPLIMAMPAEQGAAAWPSSQSNHVILAHDGELPLQNNSINRVFLIHSVEYSEHLNAMMQEVWRVLVPGGRVLAVVPNRMSFWSNASSTPLGFGRPFNALQLRGLFTHHHFTITRSTSALFTTPLFTRISPRFSRKIEKIGHFLWWFLGGVLIIEAEKQLYASIREPVFVRKLYRLQVGARATASANANKKDQAQK
jgi:SAM-dependent methyltransferase